MALTIEEWLVVENIRQEAARKFLSKPGTKPQLRYCPGPWFVGSLLAEFVGEKTEGESIVEEYERIGVRYGFIYEMRYGTWVTPAGEVRPCTQKTKILVGLRRTPT